MINISWTSDSKCSISCFPRLFFILPHGTLLYRVSFLLASNKWDHPWRRSKLILRIIHWGLSRSKILVNIIKVLVIKMIKWILFTTIELCMWIILYWWLKGSLISFDFTEVIWNFSWGIVLNYLTKTRSTKKPIRALIHEAISPIEHAQPTIYI